MIALRETTPNENYSLTVKQQVIRFIDGREGQELEFLLQDLLLSPEELTLPRIAFVGGVMSAAAPSIKKAKFKAALEVLGWRGGIAKSLIRIGEALLDFCVDEIEAIEENAIAVAYRLATGNTPIEVMRRCFQRALDGVAITGKLITQLTKEWKKEQPKKEISPWVYIGGKNTSGGAREYKPPRLSEESGLFIEANQELGLSPRQTVEVAIALLAEQSMINSPIAAPTNVIEFPSRKQQEETVAVVQLELEEYMEEQSRAIAPSIDQEPAHAACAAVLHAQSCDQDNTIPVKTVEIKEAGDEIPPTEEEILLSLSVEIGSEKEEEESIAFILCDETQYMAPHAQIYRTAKSIKQCAINAINATAQEERARFEGERINLLYRIASIAKLADIWYDDHALRNDNRLHFIVGGRDFLAEVANEPTPDRTKKLIEELEMQKLVKAYSAVEIAEMRHKLLVLVETKKQETWGEIAELVGRNNNLLAQLIRDWNQAQKGIFVEILREYLQSDPDAINSGEVDWLSPVSLTKALVGLNFTIQQGVRKVEYKDCEFHKVDEFANHGEELWYFTTQDGEVLMCDRHEFRIQELEF